MAYGSPSKRALGELIGRARQSAYLGLHADETAAQCTFMIPEAHPLESWGDARAFDGTTSIVQPLVDPLFGGRTTARRARAVRRARGHATSAYDLVRARFREDQERSHGASSSEDFERRWRRALKQGVIDGTAIAEVDARIDWTSLAGRLARTKPEPPPALELVVRPDPHVHDGRFAANAWLLELPTPITKLTWTNAATLSSRPPSGSASRAATRSSSMPPAASVTAPAVVVPGQANDTIGLTLGWGRSHGAELARGRGANAFTLLADAPLGVELRKTGRRRDLAITQAHQQLEGREEDILHQTTLDEHRARSAAPRPKEKRLLKLYEKEPGPAAHQWGMAIDLARCTGCGACVIACQAENNIPTVGPDAVYLGREMHWLRIDTYFAGDRARPA